MPSYDPFFELIPDADWNALWVGKAMKKTMSSVISKRQFSLFRPSLIMN